MKITHAFLCKATFVVGFLALVLALISFFNNSPRNGIIDLILAAINARLFAINNAARARGEP